MELCITKREIEILERTGQHVKRVFETSLMKALISSVHAECAFVRKPILDDSFKRSSGRKLNQPLIVLVYPVDCKTQQEWSRSCNTLENKTMSLKSRTSQMPNTRADFVGKKGLNCRPFRYTASFLALV
jgi:hypothetical protein